MIHDLPDIGPFEKNIRKNGSSDNSHGSHCDSLAGR